MKEPNIPHIIEQLMWHLNEGDYIKYKLLFDELADAIIMQDKDESFKDNGL